MISIFKKVSNDHSNLTVFVLTSIVSIGAYIYVNSQNLVLAFEDGRAHLDIARRIVDSQTPGLTQLGAIWLPLPHLLMLPLVWNDYLWHSGLAGVLPAMLCYALSSLYVYKLISDLFNSKLSGYLSVLLFLSNPNILFIQATPMTESISLFFYVASVYYFWIWLKTKYYPYIIITATFVCFGTLSRYDNWVLPIVIVLGVILFGVIKRWSISRIEGRVILFTIPAFLGIFFWILYNALIFYNPLYFAVGEGSARWFAQYEAVGHNLLAKGNIITASYIYFTNVIDTLGIVFVGSAVIGLLIFLIKFYNHRLFWEKLFLLALVVSPLVFNVYSLYSGNSVMWSRWVQPYKIYNVRYALQALPALVLLISSITLFKPRITSFFVLGILIAQIYLFSINGPVVLLQDITQTKGSPREQVGQWLRNNPTNGLTLISAGVNEVAIFDSYAPIKKFIYEGNKDLWKLALKTPYPLVSRIVMGSEIGPQTDKVYNALYGKTVLTKFYILKYQKDGYFVYDRKYSEDIDKSLWKIKSIDTMKTSRDRAKEGLKNNNYIKEIQKVKETGASYITVDTPYDQAFYPVLKGWADKAHSSGLQVWFRGNWSGWEGWNDYPKSMTRQQHITNTVNFILKHPEVFHDGDSFTACPECEYGGAGNPLETKDYEGFRKFMIDEQTALQKAFKKINKNVIVTWFSINPDVARAVYTQDLLDKTGGIITLDYFVKDAKELDAGLNYFKKKFPKAKLLIGEFGAPIGDINGSMTEEQQNYFVRELLQYISTRDDVIGVNYWVSSEGETAILDNNLNFKQVAYTLRDYYSPQLVKVKITDVFGNSLNHIVVTSKDGSKVFISNNKGEIVFHINENDIDITTLDDDYQIQEIKKIKNEAGINFSIVLLPKNPTLYQQFILLTNKRDI